MEKHCYIFAAGDLLVPVFLKSDSFIIAADAGYLHAQKNGIIPDIVVGDFDSLCEKLPPSCKTVKYPAEKDYTDTELAIRIAMEKGFDSFTVIGAVGGDRIDHTIANLQLAVCIAKEAKSITLTDGITVIKALHNGSMSFCGKKDGYISVFSFDGTAEGVTIKGLKYELDNVSLPCTGTLGVSNEFTGKDARISVTDGTLLIVYKDKESAFSI